jgi:predicted nucleic acid-binding protein
VGAVALDASVVIALFDADDAHHSRAVDEIGDAFDRGEELSMAASAYSEIMVHALRQGQGDLIDRFVDHLRIDVVEVDREVGRRAGALRAEQRSLRLPDALVLASAQRRGARLLTFDERLAQL